MAVSFGESQIARSWIKNAAAWTAAVREGKIESRLRVTNRAIVEAVRDLSPRSVLDIGCGEGWLVRELVGHGINAIGIDVVPELIDAARSGGAGEFHVMSYEDIAGGALSVLVDVVVCNFSLFGKESVEALFRAVPALLTTKGAFIIQTLHPVTACGEQSYRDGWREGSWAGCGDGFSDPAPWYFRTLESWRRLFADSGLKLREMREPLDSDMQRPASVIFIGGLGERRTATDTF